MQMEFPALHVLDQNFQVAKGTDAELSVAGELERTNLLGPVVAGQTVVLTAGSRGIDSMATVLRSLAQAVKARGANPLVLPAMESHAGGTAGGQMAVLEHLGLTPGTVGAPIHDLLEPVEIGIVEGCAPCGRNRQRNIRRGV